MSTGQDLEAKEDSIFEIKRRTMKRKEISQAKHPKLQKNVQERREAGNLRTTGGSGEPQSRQVRYLYLSQKACPRPGQQK